MKDFDSNYGFCPVSNEAATEYEQKRDELVAYVDSAMFAQKDIEALIGARGADLMKNNHRNHAAFISMVLSFNRFDVLYAMLPWVYRAYHNHGFSYDYFPRELECWILALYTHLSPESAREIEPLYRRLIDLHEDSISRSKTTQNFDRLIMVSDRWRNSYLRYRQSLLNADINACMEIAKSDCRNRADAIEFQLNVIQPALYWIGDLWERGEITVAEEHMATAICARVISGLTWMFRDRKLQHGRATVLAVTGEHHELGAWMVADALETEGWDVAFLGGNIPIPDLMAHLAIMQPHVLALSAAMPYNVLYAKRIIARVKKDSSMRNMKIIVGGLAFLSFPNLWKDIGADAFGENAKEAVKKANEFWSRMKANEM
ncbi:MAG: cobalamin-dependent protein [Spirochaetes bacterium]|nr:cobalamin-dependent protein [Spirochaetota bacterium]